MTIREKKRELNPNLTFEEFEALANRQPNLKGSWIYRVTQAIYKNNLKHPYPKFELDYSRECYFKTLRKTLRMFTAAGFCKYHVVSIPNMMDMVLHGSTTKMENSSTIQQPTEYLRKQKISHSSVVPNLASDLRSEIL